MPRNSSGTYSLPAGNPVVSGTLIETNWANPTMSDLGSALTDSLDRFGRGGMLAQLKLADGTLAAPAFAFNSEASTGIFRPGAASLSISVLGSLAATFTNTAITFAKPTTFSSTVTFSGAITLAGVLAFFGGTAALPGLAVAGDLDTGFYSVTANTVGASTNGVSRWLTTDEGLGLNTTVAALSNVGPQLQVRGRDATHGGYITAVESGGSAWLSLYSGITVGDNPSIIFNNTGALRFGTSAAQATTTYAELMRLTAAGRLGIGRTPVASLLEVAGSVGLVLPSSAVDLGYSSDITSVASIKLGFNNSGAPNVYGAPTGAMYVGSAQAVPIVFTTTGAERMRVAADGKVGIGASPSSQLDVVGGGAASYASFRDGAYAGLIGKGSQIIIGSAASDFGIFAQIGNLVFGTGANAERMRIDASGNVGIGTAPSARLDVRTSVAGAGPLLVGNTGALTSFIAGAFSNFTDADFQIAISGAGAAAPSRFASFGPSVAIPLLFNTANTERMRINGAGLIGVNGTTSNGSRININTANTTTTAGGSTDNIRIASAASGGDVNFVLTDNTAWNSYWGVAGVGTASEMYWSQTGNGSFNKRLALTSDGRFYGTALHNNAGAVTGTTNQYVASGTYTPTFTIVQNVTSPGLAAGNAKWMRVGNVVTVSLFMQATAGANSATAAVGISLPIASNLANAGDLAGCATYRGAVAGNTQSLAGTVTGDSAADRAQVDWTLLAAASGGVQQFSVMFQYEIL